jgi:outer membrane protein OmpA-like peptidoglycan-associated protein
MRTSLSVLMLLLAINPSAQSDESVPGPRVKIASERIEISAPILFDAGKATIKPVSFPILSELAELLARNTNPALVEVGVHSDERGADEYNLRISDERAAAVKAWLIEHGVKAGRLRSRGYGETKPLCTEHNEACWSRNRRTEFLIVGK